VAAFLAEPVRGAGGVIVPPDEEDAEFIAGVAPPVDGGRTIL
jgi:4-aminobutyrate aminotransferase-like enzyme